MGGLAHEAAAGFLAFYWGGLMIGRFMGAFALSDMRPGLRNGLVVAVPMIAFLTIVCAPAISASLSGGDASAAFHTGLSNALHYGGPLLLLLVAFFIGSSSAHRLLALFGTIIIGLLATGMWGQGEVARWAVLGVGLFCSIMWSNIFSLAIEGLGPLKSQGSSLLIMAILGGAFLPPLQGLIADRHSIQLSFIVPMLAFAYVVFYGAIGYRIGRTNPQS